MTTSIIPTVLPPEIADKAKGLMNLLSMFGDKKMDLGANLTKASALSSALGLDVHSPLIAQMVVQLKAVHEELSAKLGRSPTVSEILAHPSVISTLHAGAVAAVTPKAVTWVHAHCPACNAVCSRDANDMKPCLCGYSWPV
jgi:hypothetical protein